MAKTVYIETSVPSAYVSRRSDAGSVHRRAVTRRWWHEQAAAYDLVTSQATIAELSAGDYPGKDEALALVETLPILDVTTQTDAIAELYIMHKVMPSPVSGDASHLAIASLFEADVLLTWNLRHLANPSKVEHIAAINRRIGLVTPLIVSPEALWSEGD